MESDSSNISTMRLYGSAIAIVSGIYSLYLSTSTVEMSTSAWGMLALGVVVLVHGVILFTPAASWIGSASGPLMIAYAALMLANQAWMTSLQQGNASGMDTGMMGDPMSSGMGADAGMVAIAVLMLISGIIMTVRRKMMG